MIVAVLKLKGAPNVATTAEDFRIYPGSVMAADGVPYDPFSGVERRPGRHRCMVDLTACKGQLTAQGVQCGFDWDSTVWEFYFELKAKAFRWKENGAPLSSTDAAFRNMVLLKAAESRDRFLAAEWDRMFPGRSKLNPHRVEPAPVLTVNSFEIQALDDESMFDRLLDDIRRGESKGLFFEAPVQGWERPLTGVFYERDAPAIYQWSGDGPAMVVLLRRGQNRDEVKAAARPVFVDLLLGEFESQPIGAKP